LHGGGNGGRGLPSATAVGFTQWRSLENLSWVA